MGGEANGGLGGAETSGGRGGGGAGGGSTGGSGTGGSGNNGGGGAPDTCGNGEPDEGEECDDGEETADCNANCTLADCGDGIINPAAGEQCDDEGESDTCNEDCTEAACGDGVVNATAGEECDGELASYQMDQWWDLTQNYCPECKLNVCGDGIHLMLGASCTVGGVDCSSVSPTVEACDDGMDTAGCDADCSLPFCGDGYVNLSNGEECDDRNFENGDGCDMDCKIEP